MSYRWEPAEYERLPEPVRKARELLEDWFGAMENGSVEQRLPDPLYSVTISQERADKIVALLDEEFDRELSWASNPDVDGGGYNTGPGFSRLRPIQRLALAQQLHQLLMDVGSGAPAEIFE